MIGIPVTDIRKEVKNITDTYRKERKKVIASERSGQGTDDIYEPTLAWYQTADAFLKPVIKMRPTMESVQIPKNVSTGMKFTDFTVSCFTVKYAFQHIF